MNTLNRDRNALKRLVESYGKKDVLNFVRHLNEGSEYIAPNILICVDTSGSVDKESYDKYLINDILYVCDIDYGAAKRNAQVKIAAFDDEGIYYMNNVKNMHSSILSNINISYSMSGGSDFKKLLNDISKSLPKYGPYTEVIIISDADIYGFENEVDNWAKGNKHRFDTYVVIEDEGSMICVYK